MTTKTPKGTQPNPPHNFEGHPRHGEDRGGPLRRRPSIDAPPTGQKPPQETPQTPL